MNVVNEQALKAFRAMNPKLSEDANKRANQEKMFLNTFINNGKYQVEGSDIILLDSEGKRVEDAHGNRIKFDKYVQQLTSDNFDLLKQPPGGGAGNSNDDPAGNPDKEPNSIDEFNAIRSIKSGKEMIDYHNKYCKKFDIKEIIIKS